MTEQAAVKHLAWRAGYGLTPGQWREPPSLDDLVDQLFGAGDLQDVTLPKRELATPGMLDDSVVDLRRIDSGSLRDLRGTWLNLLAFPDASPLREKMAVFWHGHFACHTILPGWARRQMQTLRKHSLGNFRELLLAISRDVAMLHYLNNQQNRKSHPNENFARELMELFTIGHGKYTEQDVQEAARAFTGWTSNLSGEFVIREDLHDDGTKTFMGHTGTLGGEDIIDILLEREETAGFLARKVYRYFVNPHADAEHVNELARYFYQNDYHIAGLMHYLFTRDWFYADQHRGAKIKSPVELVAGLMRLLDIQTVEKQALHRLMLRLGQVFFAPPSVAGWAGHRHWINNATLPLRLSLPSIMFSTGSPLQQQSTDLEGHFYFSQRRFEKHLAGFTTAELAHNLIAMPPMEASEEPYTLLQTAIRLMGSLPYQMC